jgi:hypothetical protein
MRFSFPIVVLLLISGAWLEIRAMGLNEIMFDPSGNENTDEFVELYNDAWYPVSLSGWTISDGTGSDSIVALDQGLLALPHQYVLIMDPDYFSLGSTTYDGMIPEDALVVTIDNATLGDRGLSNSSPETISLTNPDGAIVSSYTYSPGNVSGRSDERILMSVEGDTTNWADAVEANGTPGGRNSVTAPERDLSIVSMQATPSAPRPGDDFSIRVTVANAGLNSFGDTLVLWERWPQTVTDSLVVLRAWPTGTLLPGDSIDYQEAGLTAGSAPRYFRAELTGSDDRPENNARDLTVSSAGTALGVVINEIMYMPDAGMSEWFELVNSSASALMLTGWRVADGTGLVDTTRRYWLPDVMLAPDSFLLLAADSAVFFEHLPHTALVLVWGSAPVSLNNNGDSLLIWDQIGELVDRVDYRPSWGGSTGVSMERVSANSGSNDPLNWASSIDSTGGTPGRANSRLFPGSGGSSQVLTLEPNPFSPDGDGRDDLLRISYRLDYSDSRLDLVVYDVRGRKVSQLASHAAAGYTGEVLWDGRDEQGRELPTGLYIIYLEAAGRGASRVQSARRVVALARPS